MVEASRDHNATLTLGCLGFYKYFILFWEDTLTAVPYNGSVGQETRGGYS